MAARPSVRPVSFTQLASGAALLSEGYCNGIMGAVITVLTREYPESQFGTQYYSKVLASITFPGIVCGALIFGWTSDRRLRIGLAGVLVLYCSVFTSVWSSIPVDVGVLVSRLCFLRFLLGIGVGAGHPSVLVHASELAELESTSENVQYRWLVVATNTMINVGFAIAAFVPLVLYWMLEEYFDAVWGLSIGFGTVSAFLWWPPSGRCNSLERIPYWLTFKRYWKDLLRLSLSWFIYGFIAYPLCIYSSMVMNSIMGGSSSLLIVFGWSIVISLLSLAGTVLGAFIIDYLGPKTTMIVGLLLQAAIGFGMGVMHSPLNNHITVFALVYGIFLSLGELGPGNCLSVLAARTAPLAIREWFYGIVVAVGNVGAVIGIWFFPNIIDAFGGSKTMKGNTGPFWIFSGLAILSVLVTFFMRKPCTHDGIKTENKAFCQYLKENGFDVSLASPSGNVSSSIRHRQDEKLATSGSKLRKVM
ncbi:major facilitator superfamily domain-containing protein [Pisolithus tinctorius]|uniref:Major facilitator superfamily (MFS) profile domain-containing protein n=1 Tax=Pisolithus tinctorius Marx 270 TaxID=870435 RepID=A0A0C3NFB3_PISTI|nr:major facilitator superfamily domain-containing protein [Pisolithus tinctorius]KIN99744.1 hypothetical protein M404DRAFT_1004462 [Pisolithus tinctorius Marx 270]